MTAGPHDVGFTWNERPFERQDVWQPSLRDSQEVHMIGGLPRLKTVGVEGPYNVTGVSATPSRDRIFVCRPATAVRRGAGVRHEDPHEPGAPRVSAAGHGRGRRGAAHVLQAGARERRQLRRRHPRRASRAFWPARRSCTASNAIRPACGRALRTRSATSSSRRGCRSSCGAASRTRAAEPGRRPASSASRACSRRRCGA